MIAPQCVRERQQLSELLAGQLTETATVDVTQHLEHCDDCRRHLELLAAGSAWWHDAQQYLSDDELDLQQSSSNSRPDAACDGVVSVEDLLTSFVEPSDDPSLLGRLDTYDIQGVIGCGGMGIVLRGRDRALNRLVAIKVLAPHYATSAAARKRFAREAQAAAAVVHPHVLAIHGVNANARLPFLVMPLVAGQSLQQSIDAHGPMDVRDVLRIGLQAAQGLHAAHAQGLVHRDVKPANILLENGVQRVLLTDFGLARAIDDVSLTRSGTIAGTPEYMSPEQARGEAVDHRTDLLSLGSVLYAMCAGRPPFRADTTMGVLRRICDDTPHDLRDINPDVPDWLAAIISKLLARSREDRFQSADEVAGLLERCLAHLQHPTSFSLPHAVTTLVARSRRAHVVNTLAMWPILVVAAVLGLVGWSAWCFPPEPIKGANNDQTTAPNVADPSKRRSAPPTLPKGLTQWHDGFEPTLIELEAEFRRLERTADQPW
ncbi:MAG: protein kinase domain-containing protein [Pirellulaceae bacterium]